MEDYFTASASVDRGLHINDMASAPAAYTLSSREVPSTSFAASSIR